MKKILLLMLTTFFSLGMICYGAEVSAPAAGETLFKNVSFTIKWNLPGGGSHVIIKLLQNGIGKGKIVESTENDGEYEWPVDKLVGKPLPLGDHFKIRVKSTSSTASILSAGEFSIKYRMRILEIKPYKPIFAVFTAKPDLQVTKIEVSPSGPSANFHTQKARFKITVYNDGLGKASACKMDLWLYCYKSGDPKPSGPGPINEYWMDISVPAVGSKKSETFEPDYGKYTSSPQSVPGHTIGFFGRWWAVKVQVDARGTVTETYENNNSKFEPFWVPE